MDANMEFARACTQSNASMARSLLKEHPDVDVNAESHHGNRESSSLLDTACLNNNADIIKLLLAHPRIDCNIRDKNGMTPLMTACATQRVSAIRLLLSDARVNPTLHDNLGCTALWHASYNNRPESVVHLIASGKNLDFGRKGEVDDGSERGRGGARTAHEIARFEDWRDIIKLLDPIFEVPRTRDQVEQNKRAVEMARVRLWRKNNKNPASLFSHVVFHYHEVLQVNKEKEDINPSAVSFFGITKRVPRELQMLITNMAYGLNQDTIRPEDSSRVMYQDRQRLIDEERARTRPRVYPDLKEVILSLQSLREERRRREAREKQQRAPQRDDSSIQYETNFLSWDTHLEGGDYYYLPGRDVGGERDNPSAPVVAPLDEFYLKFMVNEDRHVASSQRGDHLVTEKSGQLKFKIPEFTIWGFLDLCRQHRSLKKMVKQDLLGHARPYSPIENTFLWSVFAISIRSPSTGEKTLVHVAVFVDEFKVLFGPPPDGPNDLFFTSGSNGLVAASVANNGCVYIASYRCMRPKSLVDETHPLFSGKSTMRTLHMISAAVGIQTLRLSDASKIEPYETPFTLLRWSAGKPSFYQQVGYTTTTKWESDIVDVVTAMIQTEPYTGAGLRVAAREPRTEEANAEFASEVDRIFEPAVKQAEESNLKDVDWYHTCTENDISDWLKAHNADGVFAANK